MTILKSKLELYLQQIFRMLLESKTEEAIAKVSTKTKIVSSSMHVLLYVY